MLLFPGTREEIFPNRRLSEHEEDAQQEERADQEHEEEAGSVRTKSRGGDGGVNCEHIYFITTVLHCYSKGMMLCVERIEGILFPP